MNALLTALGWVDLAATVTLSGGLAYASFVAPPSDTGLRALRRAAAILGAVLVAEFVVTAFRMRELSELRGAALLANLLATRWGHLWVLRSLGLAALAAGAVASEPRWRALAGLAVLWLLARSLQGHAGAHGTAPALIDWVHLVAATVWLGGLVQLALSASSVPADVAWRMRRLATAALAFLLPAGVYGAFLHVPNLDRLVDSPYGRTLLAKLALATVLVGLGAANHFRHVPEIARGDVNAPRRLRRTVRGELLVGAAVLLLSALLGVLPMPHEPPR